MSKFFIDCGAHMGESIRLFKKAYPNSSEFKVISFEPNPDLVSCFDEFSDVEFHSAAVSTYDGTAEYFTHQWTVGNTLCKENSRVVPGLPPRIVPCVDLSQWMLSKFTKEDYVILKMDVEGFEYEILQKMFDDGSFDLVDKLYIEWHYGNRPIAKEIHDKVRATVHEKGLHDWYWQAGPSNDDIEGKHQI